jgi:hypothetical protein
MMVPPQQTQHSLAPKGERRVTTAKEAIDPAALINEFAESWQGPLTKNIVSSAACHEPSPSFL